MTATIKPPDRDHQARRKPIRFSFMESLGFSDAVSVWSDRPPPSRSSPQPPQPSHQRGRHEASPPLPDPLAGWTPAEVGSRLSGGNFRWGLATLLTSVVAGLTFFGFWLLQRPNLEAESLMTEVLARAGSLEAGLDALERINGELSGPAVSADTSDLLAVETTARALFQISANIPTMDPETRAAVTGAASTALDAARMLNSALSYRQAVIPILVSPDLETDPTLIELDEAARAFGDWQLGFDNVRTALPSSVLSDVTNELDALSRELPTLLRAYVDALREDDQAGVTAVITDLDGRLGEVEDSLGSALTGVQESVTTRIEDARHALALLLG